MNKARSLLYTKHPTASTANSLRRCLSAFDLTLLGIGAIIGTGLFVLTGIAAATKAGPAIILSYALAGFASAFSALAYAELASSIGGCGSAYSYAYAGLGEIIAWVIGWDLLLEYGLSTSGVAIGWSGYVTDLFHTVGINMPPALCHSPFEGGIINIPAMFIIILITAFLAIGIKESVRFNCVIVFIKLFSILFFICMVAPHFDIANWHPFFPYQWTGVANGAGLIFFAYIGFDAVSTAAEEAINPQRDLPLGIITSLAICTIIYMVASGLLTGVAHYSTLNVSSAFSRVLIQLNHRIAASFIAVGAVAGLTTVILVMYYGFTRIFLAMARDQLLPSSLAQIYPKTQTPLRIILLAGSVMTLFAGFLPLHKIAELVNIGTLAAFVVVSAGVIILRYTQPNLPRPFKTPWCPIIPGLGIALCLYLIASLHYHTWINFIIWTAIGLVLYFCYSRKQVQTGQ